MTGRPEDPDLELLAADFPAWRVGHRDGLVNAWLPGTRPPLVLRADTVAGLRQAIEDYESGGTDAG